MRSSFYCLLTAILVAGMQFFSPIRAQESPVIPGAISVVGEGVVETLPDAVEVDFRVNKLADSVENAKAVVDRVVSEVLTVCADLGIDRSLITATDLNLEPRSTYDSPTGYPQFQGYVVSRGVTVRLKKISAFNDLVHRAIHAGVNEIRRIELTSSKERELREQALLTAIRDARRQAETIAREAGRALDKVSAVATADAQEWNGYSAANDVITVHAEKTPEFQPGPKTISMRVFMSFTMK